MELLRPKKIFIVDDDEMQTEALKDYLTRKIQHKVSVFQTGEDCLKHLDENPDIIVLDYFLNSVDKNAANGMEVTQTRRKYNQNVHIIMLSSQEKYSIALQSIAKGAEQYVIKDADAFEKISAMVNEMD